MPRNRAVVPAAPDPPAPPTWLTPAEDWEHYDLYRRVIDALYALPALFETSLRIAGVRATDLHTLNTALGASIEQSVVDNLNALRKIWDPDDQYRLYSFVRQAQTFPDVLLQSEAPSGARQNIILGIELKGWFALSKEGEPSFRYKATPAACAEADLLVVFPWILSEVVSGAPKLLEPFVTGARHAAEHRNYYWVHIRGKAAAEVNSAAHQTPYPKKSEKYLDQAVNDSGGNFGRVARGGFMTDFISELMRKHLAGIPMGAWQRFIKLFTESYSEETIQGQVAMIEGAYRTEMPDRDADGSFGEIREALVELVRAIHNTERAGGN